MKVKKLFVTLSIILSMLMFSTMTFAANPSADVFYQESVAGVGLWQYDYTLENTSASDFLFGIRLEFGSPYTISDPVLPSEWNGSWGIISPTSLLEAHTYNPSYQIAALGSLPGFSFTIDHQIGSVPFTAFFDDHSGTLSTYSGDTELAGGVPVVPEPISSVLFLIGGSTLAARGLLRKKRVTA